MIISPNLITAMARPVSGSKPLEGIGRVERQVDDSTYVIGLGRKSMTVRLTGGSLSVGQQVNVTAREQAIVIERLGHQPSAGDETAADSFLLSSASFRTGLKAAIDSLIEDLAGSGAQAQAIGRGRSAFEAFAADLAGVDPALTNTVRQLLDEAASGPDGLAGTPEKVRHAIELLSELRSGIDEPAASPAPAGRAVLLETQVDEGYYAFGSSKDLFDFLGTDPEADPSLAAALDRLFSRDGTVIVRTSRLNDAAAAALLTPDETRRELESLPAGFASRAFQSIPPTVFEQILSDRGTLDLGLLRGLDGFAQAQQLPAVPLRAGSAEARQAALGQWLSAVSDAGVPSRELASLLPAFSASSIINSVEEIASAAEALPEAGASLPQPERLGLTAETIAQTSDRSLLFTVLVTRLGLDFENTLATTGMAEPGSLKNALLSLAGAVSPVQIEAGKPDSAPPWQTVHLLLSDFRKAAASIIDGFAALPRAGQSGSGVQQDILETLDRISAELRALFESKTARLTVELDKFQSAFEAQADRPDGSAAAGKGLTEAEIGAALKNAAQRFDIVLQQLSDELKTLTGKYGQLLADRYGQTGFKQLSPLVQKAVEEVLRSVERTAGELARRVDEFRASLTKELTPQDHAPRNAAGRLEQAAGETKTSGNDARETNLFRQTLHQSLETALSRLESVQLLARTCPTAAGDQQIVALPVKVGNEWTEMLVRFVRRRPGTGEKSSPGRYTVYLNVAPSLLGAIGCRIDYAEKKTSHVVLEFENKETMAWFAGRKNDLRKTLVALGLPSPNMEIRQTAGGRKNGGSDAPPAPSDATIDLKA